jgi:galactokinase
MRINKIKISTPGRICLFGEHQDYLGLPIIASAISKRIYIEGTKRKDSQVNIGLLDLNSSVSFIIGEKLEYQLERDYLRSAVNIMLKNNFTFSNGFDCIVTGEIPINAGTSSSSALIIGWINFLSRMSDQAELLTAEKIAELAYCAEVLEFSEPGGMMDHYSTAVGGVIWLGSQPEIQLKKIDIKLGAFVLGNSSEPKDTKFILSRVKRGVLNISKELMHKHPDFSLQTIRLEELTSFQDELKEEQMELLEGTVRNRDITFEAEQLLNIEQLDERRLGRLMNEHQKVLQDILKISTTKIDMMINAALDAGAYGAKINGSGGGGCMFAYAPENPERVLAAVKKISNEVWIVYSDEGTREES